LGSVTLGNVTPLGSVTVTVVAPAGGKNKDAAGWAEYVVSVMLPPLASPRVTIP
jgi:hypothetical protein